MEEDMAGLSIKDGEEEAWQINVGEDQDRFLSSNPLSITWFDDGGNGQTVWWFIGKFVAHDTKLISQGGHGYMRVHAKIDVQSPLKRRKKISLSEMNQLCAIFLYEKLTLLCFLCRRLGHGGGGAVN
ncbi:hypothetical protein J1N35_045071 [Gossypium stocksii]|uniref:Zinc knuckle CX2CX4HX4C domain-containing protein n=1 Tax=Gossypium stocksii TaxID=47602 RepID=A0A9D3UAE0_9ROSI|nr:hypothetical protein J1N35_045071 [Gossypium stocksii]